MEDRGVIYVHSDFSSGLDQKLSKDGLEDIIETRQLDLFKDFLNKPLDSL